MYRRIIVALVALIFVPMIVVAQPSSRLVRNLNEGWRFFYSWDSEAQEAEYVSLPHCWDSVLGASSYYSSTANYTRNVTIPAEWSERRLFMRFGGVNSVADLFVNGRYVGTHRGGFTAFTMEITEFVRFGADNFIRVVVSNSERNDMLPISTDVDIMAGIYRDVELVVTPKSIVSPLYYSSDGLFVVQRKVSKDGVEGVVQCHLSAPTAEQVQLTMRIVGPDGYEVDHRTMRVSKLSDGKVVEIPFEVGHPELWSPASPSMYRVEVVVDDGKARDEVAVSTGFRTIAVDDENRLCINGVPYSVRGVNMAHDRRGVGMALSKNQVVEDFDCVRGLGANAVRSLIGPHTSLLYDMCDRTGVLAWVDMPFSRSTLGFLDICYYPTPQFKESGFEMLKEIVYQNFNHPSVVMWGLFNLVWQRGDDVVAYVKELNELAHSIDASRMTVGASNSDGEINFVTDLIVLRQDVGYYKGSVEDVAVWCRQLKQKQWGSKMCYGVCYGEEGVMTHTSQTIERAQRGERYMPERRQTYMHENYSAIIDSVGNFWGVWLDNIFDYGSSRRTYGVNNSGLVCHDHATRKDAYYLYRAKWNGAVPTLHIANRRWRERVDTLQRVDVYSSVGEPLMLVNGDTATLRMVAPCHYRADSVVMHNRVVVEVSDVTNCYSDRAEFEIVRK